MRTLNILSWTLLVLSCSDRHKILYHQFEPTASDNAIIRWNISSDSLPKWYVQETVDRKGRVTDLKFYENGSLNYDRLCYLPPWIKFEYPNASTIVETSLDANGKESCDLECGLSSQTTFYLTNNQKTIVQSSNKCSIDTLFYLKNGFTSSEIDSAVREINGGPNIAPMIGGYSKSFAKLDGKLPVSKSFDIKTFYFNETEKREILKALTN